ncbi:hypothetical protein TCAL_16887 [Tigriopus californicus]|uniref:Uncharacterized protein n=1 Tax=Tigriopus californicus TaxID=6832 RepID=A0A553P697_TIGCA|nr:hypothetical protein TCAL_16887 [Tigriopus californicus]
MDPRLKKSVTSHLRPHRSHAESSSALPGSASIPSAEGTTLQYTRKESRQATRDKDTTDIPQMENKGHLAQNLQSRGSSPGLNRVTRDLKRWSKHARLGFDRISSAISRFDYTIRNYRPFGGMRKWRSPGGISRRQNGPPPAPYPFARLRAQRPPLRSLQSPLRVDSNPSKRRRWATPQEMWAEIVWDLKHFKVIEGIPSWIEMEHMYGNMTQDVQAKLRQIQDTLSSPFKSQPQSVDRVDSDPDNFRLQTYVDQLLTHMSNEIKSVKIGGLPSINDVTDMSRRFKAKIKDDIETKLGIKMMKKLDSSLSLDQEPLEFFNTFINITLGQSEYSDSQEIWEEILKIVDPLNMTQSSMDTMNAINSKIISVRELFDPKTAINSAVDMQNLKDIGTMIPTLIPIIFEMHGPKIEELFLGTNFTLKELYVVHESLQRFQAFLERVKMDLKADRAPTMVRLFDLLLERNLRALTLLLKLMPTLLGAAQNS